VEKLRFVLKGIRIDGITRFPASVFQVLYDDKIGKQISLKDLFEIADKIEQFYQERGFFLAHAYVPPQHVNDGVFRIVVSEGAVSAVRVEGGNEGTQAITRAYLEPTLRQKPVEFSTIERGILLTNDLPGVRATGTLAPSEDVQGAADLVMAEEQPLLGGGIGVDNRGSRFSGLWTIVADGELNGITGPDQLATTLTVSPWSLEQIEGQARYRRAIGGDGAIAALNAVVTHGEPGSTLSAFNVRTDSWAVGPRLSFPIKRSRALSVSIDAGFTVQSADVHILGAPVSHDNWRVVDVSASYVRSPAIGPTGAKDYGFFGGDFDLTVDVAQGLPILGATPNRSPHLSRQDALTDFTKVNSTAHYTRALFGQFSVALSAEGQYSPVPLITGEQISFGGTQLGRGYDPGAITGDRGVGGSVEFRCDTRLPLFPSVSVEPYAYVEAAQTWYVHGGLSSLSDHSINSVGGGLRLRLPFNIAGDIEVARTLEAVPGSDGGRKATKVLMDVSVHV
jgi:hemolysin activation/secretion protein